MKGKRRRRARRVVSDVNDVTKPARSDVFVRKQRRSARIDERGLGAAVAQKISDELGGRQRVDEHRHETGADRAEDRRRVFGTIVEQHQHAATASEPDRH